MTGALGERYYRLALSAAAQRDLSGAAEYARHAMRLGAENPNAPKLLGLCLYELGELGAAHALLAGSPALAQAAGEERARAESGLEQVQALVRQKKIRRAVRAARAIPHQSVRVLNIRGCLYGGMGRYGAAVDCFSKALEKDRGNRLASAGLTDALRQRTCFWRVYEKLL